jgi:hypothetical protein
MIRQFLIGQQDVCADCAAASFRELYTVVVVAAVVVIVAIHVCRLCRCELP